MTSTLKVAQATLTGSGTQDTLVTAGGAAQVIVKDIHVVNFSASIITVKMWIDGTTNAHMILPPITLDPGDYGVFNGELVIDASGTLKAEANTASACTVTVSYVEIT